MANVTVEYSEEDFVKADTDAKLLMLFRMQAAQQDMCCKRYESCGGEFDKLKRRKWLDRSIVAITSSIATLAAAFGFKIGS